VLLLIVFVELLSLVAETSCLLVRFVLVRRVEAVNKIAVLQMPCVPLLLWIPVVINKPGWHLLWYGYGCFKSSRRIR